MRRSFSLAFLLLSAVGCNELSPLPPGFQGGDGGFFRPPSGGGGRRDGGDAGEAGNLDAAEGSITVSGRVLEVFDLPAGPDPAAGRARTVAGNAPDLSAVSTLSDSTGAFVLGGLERADPIVLAA